MVTGHGQSWPGITVRPAGMEVWDLSANAWVTVDLENTGTNKVTVYCRVDNVGADGREHCVTGSLSLDAGQRGTLRTELRRTHSDTLGGKLFGMRGYPVALGGADTVDAAKINQLLLFVSQPKEDHQFAVHGVWSTGAYVPPTATVKDADPYFPLIDVFGQYKHRDWPGKVHSEAELTQRRDAEEKAFEGDAGPADWDVYGGWKAGPLLKASGFFRVQKHEDRWWLVDPEGHLFFSQGIDCVCSSEVTPVEGRENWYEAFPPKEPEFARFLASSWYCLKGHYAGKSPRSYMFSDANLLRKYGTPWRERSFATAHKRLRQWGLNTIGMWSHWGLRAAHRTVYVDSAGSDGAKRIEGSEGYWGKFPDPFDPSLQQTLGRSMAGKAGNSAGDSWCLGYFADNELGWGEEYSLARAALSSPPEQAAKRAVLEMLKGRYDSIAALNTAWGTTNASWEALGASRTPPDAKRAAADLAAMDTLICERYFSGVRDAIKAVAPNQLYLGCRFAWTNPRAAVAAAKFCDVVSYNLYQRSVADFKFPGGADVPLIIGEFHLGALDRGMFHAGLVPVSGQEERAANYRSYVEGALRHPQFVGCHWFQYQDEPTTGRVYDEENYQIGFVDIADTPYAETVAAARQLGEVMYKIRSAPR